MLTRRELKQKSKEQLQGKVGISFLCLIIYGILVLTMVFIAAMPPNSIFPLDDILGFLFFFLFWRLLWFLISLILLPPLNLGLIKVYWEMSYDNRPNISILFSGFRQYRQTFLVSFVLFTGSLLYSVLSIILDIIFSSLLFYLGPFILRVMPLYLLWTLFLSIIYYYVALGFSMVYYIMAEQPDLSAMDVLKASWAMMKGNRWKYIVFQLSFILWILLGIVTMGIAFIYVIPYMSVANANFYHNIKRNQSIFEPVQDEVSVYPASVIQDEVPTQPVSAPQDESPIPSPPAIQSEVPEAEETQAITESVEEDIEPSVEAAQESIEPSPGVYEESTDEEDEEEWSWDNL
ncbi:MAG: DUF975 family protein [Lachnospiraceae bacterium]